MAQGAVTVTKKTAASAPARLDLISFPGDSLYPTGGTAAFQTTVRAALGVGAVEILGVIPQDCGGYIPVYDKTNDKLKLYYADNNNGSDGPLIEVPDTTDLHTVTMRLIVVSA